MDKYNERPYYSYSWHQSHDQATVILMVPYNTQEEDLSVVIERNYVVVGVKGHLPTIKGRLYSNIDTSSSLWQLEPRTTRLTARERTTSTTSTASSTHSSYALVSDPDISSSFAASLESGQVSETEDVNSVSPAFSSPGLPATDLPSFPIQRQKTQSNVASRSVSPGQALRSMSSYSSLESLQTPYSGGRLLTLHLEKEQSIIWPSLITGPVPDAILAFDTNSVVFDASQEMEHRYNMDPTSLALIGLELCDIRKDKEEAFEYFLRAWNQAHVPSATMRLVSNYFPLQASHDFDFASLSLENKEKQSIRGTLAYYLQRLGGPTGLAQLYLEAGLLHLEGAASTLLSSSYSSLSSIRMPLQAQVGEGGTEAWKRDREAASKYFERARNLQPNLDIPALPQEGGVELEMPSMELSSSNPESVHSEALHLDNEVPMVRRRRKKEEITLVDDRKVDEDDIDNTWYLYIPGLVGAGTALLVVGIVGALSFSTWSRRNQGS